MLNGMQKNKLLYEGKAKIIFETDRPDVLRMEFKDSLTAFNAQKKGEFQGKGKLNCLISTYIFKVLTKNNIPHHWLSTENGNHMIVKKTKIIPLEIVIRNVLAVSLSKKLGKPEGIVLTKPLLELYYKDDGLNDPFVNDEQAIEFGWVNTDQLLSMKSMAIHINTILKSLFFKAQLNLIDFKIEFGVTGDNKVILADEISPDCMRLWDTKTHDKFDKDRFRHDLGKIEEAYQSVLARLEGITI